LLLRLWRPFLGATVAVLAVLVWALTAPMLVWTLVPWASVYALFFQALSGTLLLGAVGRGSDRGLVLAGFVASLTFLCRQPVGIVTSIALGFFLVVHGHGTRRGLAPLLRFIGGHVIGVVPAFGFLAAEGALTDWWIQNIKTPLTWSSLEDAGGPPPSVLHKLLPALGHEMFPAAFATLTWTLLPLITLATLAVSGWIVWRTRATSAPAADAARTPTTALFLVSCLGIASWAQYVPITCIRHVYWSATFMIGVAFGASAMLASAVVARAGRPDVVRWRRLAVGLATVACLGGLFGRDIAMRIATARTRFATPYFDAGGHDIFTGMLLSPSEAFLVSKVRALAAAYPESQFIGTRHFGARSSAPTDDGPRVRRHHQRRQRRGMPARGSWRREAWVTTFGAWASQDRRRCPLMTLCRLHPDRVPRADGRAPRRDHAPLCSTWTASSTGARRLGRRQALDPSKR
jgi:hypothetical protein